MSRDDTVNCIQGINQWLCMFCLYDNLPFIHLDNDEYSDVINENFISAVPQMFNKKCTNMGTDVNSNLSIIRSNIRSLSRNINSFLSFISNLIIDFDFVCLSETWLKESNYRPPSTEIEVFNSHMENILSIIKIENKLNYITGDFNIDLLKKDTHAPSSAFLELLYSYGYLPLINKPTRVTNSSATIIDHI